MLTQMDNERLNMMKKYNLSYLTTGNEDFAVATANLLVECDDPQAVWEAHVAWGEELSGSLCPEKYRDITQTVRISQKLKSRSIN